MSFAVIEISLVIFRLKQDKKMKLCNLQMLLVLAGLVTVTIKMNAQQNAASQRKRQSLCIKVNAIFLL